MEYLLPFSGSKEIAEYIKKNNLESYTLIAFKSPYGSAVLPYLPNTKMWCPEYQTYCSYMVWNNTYMGNANISMQDVIIRSAAITEDKKILLLLNIPLDESNKNYNLLKTASYSNFWPDGDGVNENYWLYLFKVDNEESQ